MEEKEGREDETHHLLVLELVSNIARPGLGDFDPGLGERGTGGGHEGNVDVGVNWVEEGGAEGVRWGHVVPDIGDSGELGRILVTVTIRYSCAYLLTLKSKHVSLPFLSFRLTSLVSYSFRLFPLPLSVVVLLMISLDRCMLIFCLVAWT